MRLPWLSIDADGQTRARLLGRLLGVHELHGVGLAITLWTWALEMSPEGDFTGNVPGDPELIAAALSWPIGDAPRLIAQLQRVGLIATAPELRVRGLDRYRRAWEKNQRRNLGNKPEQHKGATSGVRVPVTGANPAPVAPEPARKTETETEKLKTFQPQASKLKREPKPSAAQEFFGWLNATRGSKTPLSDSNPGPRAINTVFGKALTEVGRPELEKRYLAYLNDPDWGTKSPPWPWEGFAKRWRWLQSPAAQHQARSLSL